MRSRNEGQVELQKLIYTMNWEDPDSDNKALQIQPGDTVMTITSGACNTLEFLLADPAVVHTVDINPSQSFLLELKIAAIKSLDYSEFVRFLGLAPGDDRVEVYGRLRSALSPAAAAFWDVHKDILKDGFLFQGRYDHFVRLVGKCVRLIQGKTRINRLFEDRDLESQREFFDHNWDIRRTRLIFLLFYNKHVLAKMGLKADYFRFDDGSNTFAESFRRKFKRVVYNVPVRGNYFLHVYLKGSYRSLDEVPRYLKEENFQGIKQRLDRIKVHTDDAKKWLATIPENTFECLALSNICELMSLDDSRKMFREVLRTAKPQARISFRNLILPREVPEELKDRIRKDEPLSRELIETDRSFVYSKVAAYRVFK